MSSGRTWRSVQTNGGRHIWVKRSIPLLELDKFGIVGLEISCCIAGQGAVVPTGLIDADALPLIQDLCWYDLSPISPQNMVQTNFDVLFRAHELSSLPFCSLQGHREPAAPDRRRAPADHQQPQYPL